MALTLPTLVKVSKIVFGTHATAQPSVDNPRWRLLCGLPLESQKHPLPPERSVSILGKLLYKGVGVVVS